MGKKSEEARNQRRLKLMTFLGGDIPYEAPRIIGGGGMGVTTLTKTRDNRKFKQVRGEAIHKTAYNNLWQALDSANRQNGIYNS